MALVLADFVDGGDAGVVESAGDAGFLEEAGVVVGIGLAKDLQGDDASQARVPGAPDLGAAAPPEAALQDVLGDAGAFGEVHRRAIVPGRLYSCGS